MSPTNPSQVAIFWDYENCRPSNDMDGSKVIDRIRSLVQDFGSITTFRAYIDLSLDYTYSRSMSLHSDLQSSGLTLVHCPHNGKKDVADKMMIVDMLAFAIDRPVPACIVLITGDRDFAYAAAILKLRGYHIISIAPRTARSSLKVQAHQLYDWQDDVLSGIGGTDLDMNLNGHKPTGSVGSASMSGGALLSVATESSISQDQGRDTTAPINSQAPSFQSACQDGLSTESVSRDTLYTNPSSNRNPCSFPPGTLGAEPDRETLASNAPNYRSSPSHCRKLPVDGLSGPTATSGKDFVRSQGASQPESKTIYIESETMSLLSPATDSVATIASPYSEPISTPTFDLELSSSNCDSSSSLGPFRVKFEQVDDRALIEGRARGLDPPPSIADTLDAVSIQATRSSTPNRSSLNPSAGAFQPTLQIGQSKSSEVSSLVSAHGSPTPTKADQQRFQTLIFLFIEWKSSRGLTRVISSEVASEMSKRDPQAYEKAGVTKLKPFIEEARKAGVIISPGLDRFGTAWVEINPSLYPPSPVPREIKSLVPPPPIRINTKEAGSSSGWIFSPLTNRLRQEAPTYRVLLSLLGMSFAASYADLYDRAGVSGLSAYLEKAEKLGIVKLGSNGSSGSKWAELMPGYRGMVAPGTES